MRKIVFGIAIISLVACNKKDEKDASGAPPASKPQSVQAVIAGHEALNNAINATGTIISNEEVEIRSEIQGRVTGVYFKEGERVSAGKLLVKIDDSELQAQLKRTELSILLSQDDESRKKKLLEINGISKEEYDVAQNNLLKLQVDKDLLQIQIAKTSIIAPFSGIIGLRYISEGGYVSPTNLIAVLQQVDPVKIEFSIPEKYASLLKTGASINFTVEGNTKQFTAKVFAKEPKIDPETRTVKVRALCSNSELDLIPGAFAKLKITLETIPDAIVVPSSALIPTINGQSLLLVKNNIASLQIVETGIRTENETQITNGLSEGDTVIVTGLLTVRNGMPVDAQIQELSTENK